MANVHNTDHKWYAVYTKSRCEKVVEKMLLAKKINVFLPINTYTKRWSRKVKQIQKPLINGYVFVNIIKDEYIKVLETEHIVSFLKFGNEIISIPNEEIDILRRIIGEEIELETSVVSIEVGEEVEITQGNLLGMKGILVSKESKNKFSINLDALGINITLSIDAKLLKKV